MTLNHGTLDPSTGNYTLSQADLVGLTLTVPDDDTKQISFTVTAHASEGGLDAASTSQQITFAVNPVAEAPTLTIGGSGLSTTVSGNEDNAIALPIQAALGEIDKDAVLSVTVSGVPAGVMLSAGIHNADGSWTLTPAQLSGLTLTSDGERTSFDLTVTATTVDGGDTATAASTSGTLHVNVTPVADQPTLVLGGSGLTTTVSGNEDNAIALPIQAALGEIDKDAVLTVTIAGLPSGVTLTDANHDILTLTNGSITLTPAQLAGLTLTSDGEAQHFDLTVTATTTDGGNTATAASTSGTVHVNVAPVADAPVLTIGATVSGNEDNAIALPIQAALGEADADAVLSVTISGVPAGATLSAGIHNADGSWTLTPAQLAGLTLTGDGEVQHFDLTVTATTVDGGNTATAASTSGTVHVNVTPVGDAPVLTLTTSHVSGNEDQPIALGINAALGEIDKDAVLSVVISGLPAGVTLSDANGNVLPIAFGIIGLTPAQLAGLTLTSDGEVQNFVLTVTATTVDGGNAATEALTSVGLQVDVTPVADAPTLTTSQLVFQPVAFDVSGALLTEAFGVNAQGTIVGLFEDSTSAVHGFVDKGGMPTPFDAPASTFTEVTGINDNGDIVGVFIDKSSAEHGFLETSSGTFSQIDAMGASTTLAFGINDSGTVVGRFVDGSGHIHGFSEQEQNGAFIPGTFTQIDVSLAGDTTINATRALGINNNGQIVGLFDDGSGEHGFVDTNGVFEAIDVPGAAKTNARGIDANGDVVGVFDDALGEHGFFLSASGVFTTINAGPGTFTDVLGVNASGSEVVGDFRDSAGTIHAFSATELQLLSNTVSGRENIPIALGINASLSEADADAAVTKITISGLPTGASLSDDNHDSLSIVNGSITLTPAELAGLALTSDGGDFDLTVTATTVDGGDNAAAASSSTTLHVNVMSDPPTLLLPTSHISGNEDQPIALAIIAALAEVDTDAILTVTISGLPAGVSLSDLNGDPLTISSGSITLTPAELIGLMLTSDGEVQHFDLTVTATTVDGGNPTTTASSSGTLHIDVTPVADAPTFPTIPAFLFGPPITLAGQDVHATGINDAGAIVGITEDHNSNSHIQGFILQPGGTPTIIDAPFAGVTVTQLFGINASGAIVGDATVGSTVEGFLDQGGTFTKIIVPGAAFTFASGINDAGVVVGEFIDGDGAHGFVDHAGVFTSIDVPGATFTQANGINNAGDIVGTFVDAMGGEHGFLDHNSVFTTIDVPGALFTQALGINNSGAIVGFYEDSNRLFHGFLDQGGVFTTIDASNSGFTEAFGINDAGMVAGVLGTSTAFDGFRATLNAFGAEDTPIALNIPTPTLSEADADAVLTVTVSGVPAGATLNHGTITATGANGVTTWSVNPADLATLTLTSDGETTSFNLSVTATATDGGDAATAASVTQTLHVGVTLDTISAAAQFDAVHNVLNFNNTTVMPNLVGETLQLTDAGHPGAALNASGNQFVGNGSNETLDLSGWDRAVEIDFAAGTIRLDAASLTPSGSISGFANVLGTTHNDSFDNLAGGVTVTGGAGAVDHFGLAANVLSSTSIPTITNYSSGNGEAIDLSALLAAKFGPGSNPTTASNFVEVKEDAGGNSATLEINVSGTPGGTFVAAAHLGGVHSGDIITAILDHAHTTAQLHAA